MKTRHMTLRLALVCVLGVVGCSKKEQEAKPTAGAKPASVVTPPEGPVELRVKWPVGRRYVQRMDLRQLSRVYIPQLPDPRRQDVSLSQEYAISVLKEMPEAGREVDMEYLTVRMSATADGKELMNFDSGGENLTEAANPLAGVFRQLVGLRLKFQLDASNRVQKVEGVNVLMSKILTNAPPSSHAMMTNMFTEDTFRQMVEFGKGLPAKPVKPGDNWPYRDDIAMGPMGKAILAMNFKFAGWETRDGRPCAVLDYTGNLVGSGEGGVGPMGIKMKLTQGKMTGKTWLDYERGLLVENRGEQALIMAITTNLPRIGDRGGTTQTFTNELDQIVTMKLIEVTQD